MMSAINTSRVRRLAKEGSWIIIGQIATVAGSLVLVRVLTEYLSPTQYGQLALGLTAAGFVNQVVMGGLGGGISRFYSVAAEKQDLAGYLNASSRLMVYATGGILLISLVLIAALCSLGYDQWLGLAAGALVFSVLGGYNGALSGIQNAARQRAIVAFHGGTDAWLKIGLAVAVMYWLGHTATAVVIGYSCSLILITFSQLIFLRRTVSGANEKPATNNQWLQQIWLYSKPFTIWGTFTWMQLASDRWALQTYSSMTEVGQYAVLFQLGYTPIAIVTGLVVNFLGPIMYQRSGDATDMLRSASVHRLSWQMTQLALVVTLIVVTSTYFLHDFLFDWLVAAQYRDCSYLLPWVGLAGGLFAAGQTLSLKLMSEMKSSMMTSAKITTALTGTLLNVIGASLAGIDGVVIALIIFSLSYFVWMAFLSRHPYNKN